MKFSARAYGLCRKASTKVVSILSSGRKIGYDAYTATYSSVLALRDPGRAAGFRAHRNMYRSFISGEAAGMDRNFRPRLRTADADIKRAYKLTVARCRDQVQNNPYISGCLERICNNVVRGGILPQFQIRSKAGKLKKADNKKWEALFRRWIRYADISGHDSYAALQKLGLRHMWSDGQYFIHRLYDDSLPGVVPLRLELIEFDQLDKMVDGILENGNLARRGIELDQNTAKPVAYHFLKSHPGDYIPATDRGTIRYLAADIIHVWERRRISQYSGISWFAAVVMEAYRMDEYRHIEQDGARAAAIFAAFLKSSMPDFRLGGSGLPAGGQVSPDMPAPTGAVDAPTELQSAVIQKLPGGTELQLASHNRPGDNYEPFVKDSKRAQSVGTGMSYEGFANDYTDSSYASARSGSLEERLGYKGQQTFIDEKMNWRVISWFMEAAVMVGLAPPMSDYFRDPHRYHEMVSSRSPGWQWVDERNATQAAEKKLDLVIETHSGLAAERGLIFEDVVEERIEEEIQLQEYYKVKAKTQALKEALSNEK